jgi:hypothetical protein
VRKGLSCALLDLRPSRAGRAVEQRFHSLVRPGAISAASAPRELPLGSVRPALCNHGGAGSPACPPPGLAVLNRGGRFGRDRAVGQGEARSFVGRQPPGVASNPQWSLT